jgi:peptidoglycan/xylan/chitin deacetylase (PgdA/CDA1 family)
MLTLIITHTLWGEKISERKQKKHKINKGRLSLVLVVCIVVIAGAIYWVSSLGKDGYTNESSFERYAGSYFKGIDGKKQVGESKEEIKYGEPLSQGIELPVLEKENMNTTVGNAVQEQTKAFQASKTSLPPAGKSALLMGYESYKTPEKVVGVTLHSFIREEDEHGEVKIKAKAIPYNFATKSGVPLSSPQIFSGDHTKIYKKEAMDQLNKEYGKKLKKGAEKTVLENADHFVMTDKGFKFYYDSGTILPAEEGTASVEIPYKAFASIMRDDIGNRVIDPSKPMVAITYDDGPSPDTTPQLLDLYEKHDAVCTFFELGSNVDNVEGSSKMLKRMLSLGCEIGSHTYTHPNLYTLSPDQIKVEADKTAKAIEKASGKPPTVFRPAYGNGNAEIAKIFDLPSFNWTIDTMDWSSKDKNRILGTIQGHSDLDGHIILMHSIYQPTVDATAELLPWLQERGYQLVTMTELMQYRYGGTPEKGVDYGYHPDEPKR